MSGVVDFTGQRVLVTGASSGIGAGLAEEFARRGATVGICARRKDRLEEVLARCRTYAPDSRMWVTDLADTSMVERLASGAIDELGGVDVLVNNAGIPKRRKVTSLDADIVKSVMNINYFSPINLTLALLPSMLAQRHGRIINVSSIAATLSSPGEAAYDASKAALTAFSEAMAVDLWDTGVKVLVVYPGLVDTELFSIPDNDPLVTIPGNPHSGKRAGCGRLRCARARRLAGLRARVVQRCGRPESTGFRYLPVGCRRFCHPAALPGVIPNMASFSLQ